MERVPLPDHQASVRLDEYLVADNRRRTGFSATSGQIADHLLSQWPRRDLLLKLVELNRVRKLPAELLHREATYLTHISPSAAMRYIGLRGGQGIVPRVFIARQQLLLAMRRVLVEPEPATPARTMDLDTTAIMLCHALASGSDPTSPMPDGDAEIPAEVLLEVVRNGVFNSTDDLVARLDRHWRVWSEGPAVPTKTRLAMPPSQMVEQAIGVDLEHALMYGMILNSSVMGWMPGNSVHAPALDGPGFDQTKVANFMAYVAANEQDLAARLGEEHGSWAFLPFEQTPVIDFGDGTVVVLDD